MEWVNHLPLNASNKSSNLKSHKSLKSDTHGRKGKRVFTRVLPVVVFLHEVHVVERDVVELGVVDDRGVAQVVGRVHQGKDFDSGRDPPPTVS